MQGRGLNKSRPKVGKKPKKSDVATRGADTCDILIFGDGQEKVPEEEDDLRV